MSRWLTRALLYELDAVFMVILNGQDTGCVEPSKNKAANLGSVGMAMVLLCLVELLGWLGMNDTNVNNARY